MHLPFPRISVFVIAISVFLIAQARDLTLAATPVKRSDSLAQTPTPQDRNAEVEQLQQEANRQLNRSQFREALANYQQILAIQRKMGQLPNRDRVALRKSERMTLNTIATIYVRLGEYTQSLNYYQQALAIAKELNDPDREVTTLNSMARVYTRLGDYTKALDYLQQALARGQQSNNPDRKVTTLNSIGEVYENLGQYAKALEYLQQAVTIRRELNDPYGEATALNNIGEVYENLGQYPKALEYYHQTLAIRSTVRDLAGEGMALNSIGGVYARLGQYPKALEFFQQALRRTTTLENRLGRGMASNNVGEIYARLGQYTKALGFLNQALVIRQAISDNAGEGTTLNSLGEVYARLGEYSESLQHFQQALAIRREIGDKAGEGRTLSNIGILLTKQNQPELAILFYKQSVNVTEGIRREIKGLSREAQQSFLETVAGRYRRLADLLLRQNRVLEAQQVLDLLKVQELDDYLRNVRGNQVTQQGVDYLPSEQQLLTQFNNKLSSVVQLGKELNELQTIPQAERTPQQEQRRRQLEANQRETLREFANFIRSPEIVASVQQLNRTTGRENLDLKTLRSLQDNLKKLDQKAVLLYPLVLEDRLELVLVTPYTPPIRRAVPVKREDLNRVIVEFRSALTNPQADAKIPAQQLYNWLIKPIEPAVSEAKAQTIIYAPDGQLRYIPLAALYDGNQWLVQKYRVNNITALSLTEFNSKPQSPKILAGAFAEGNFNVQVGNRQFSFDGLPFAGQEVETIAAEVPGTTKLLDREFSETETVARMSDYSIVHLATHAAFVTGKPEDSFILFGNGDRATFPDVELWPLTNTDLVVLSACETGVGGQLGNGEEILGFGYLMQQAGAKAAIASLWTVDDGGTQTLMNAFYAVLKNGNTTKAEALRQAQIALITGDYTALGQSRGLGVRQEIRNSRPAQVTNRLSHPYYWAPFILIGNGL
ncbi:tetratricopeptide repeat protein [Microcoleus sp. ZQ-A2]|nr:tetratricopeptide repeat protein [Microcoleus sp. FACHB-1]